MNSSQPRVIGHLIDGQAQDSADESIDRLAPGTGEVVSRVAAGGAAEVGAAVAAARRAFDEGPWPRMTVAERAQILTRVADLIDERAEEFARLDAEEAGKSITVARGDIAGAAGLWRYAAALALTMKGETFTGNGPDFTGIVVREPIGVVGLIIPWNFPALILSQKLPFALAAGCTAVVKPSEFTSSSAHLLVRLAFEAGVPESVINLVNGDGRAGAALSDADGIDMVSFTGSTATGERVMQAAARTMKKTSLELGGKAASLVFADADLELAAEGVVHGITFNNGECCVSQPRLLVEESIADDFVAEVARLMSEVRVGQPLSDDTRVGAMIHAAHRERVRSFVTGASSHGAEVLTGLEELTGAGFDGGQFVSPAVIDRVSPDAPAFREEIFGPVLSVTRFREEAEAVALANSVAYGLSNTIWSENVSRVLDIAKALQSGTVYVNTTIDAPPQMPFGGYKASGVGREMGEAGFEEFTELKSINIRSRAR